MPNDSTGNGSKENSGQHRNGTSDPTFVLDSNGDVGNGDLEKVSLSSERTPLLSFTQKRRQKKVNHYYDSQVQLLNSYHCDIDRLAFGDRQQANSDEERKQRKRDELLAKIVLGLNLALLIVKIVAAAMSNSLSVISTVIESGVDLVSGIIIWATSAAIQNRDPYEYPRGRTKLEPLAVIFVSIIMGVANIQVIIQAITQIVEKKIRASALLT